MRKSLKVSLAATILALTSACGAGDADLSATEAGAPDSAKASAAASSSSNELTRDDFVERIAAAQLAAGSAHLESDGQISMRGDVRLTEDVEGAEAQVTMDVGATAMELRVVDGVVYVQLGALSGGKYVRIDLKDPKGPLAGHFGSMVGQIDPSAQLKQLREALVEFENQGPGGEIDGVETTKLRLVLDTSTLLEGQDVAGPRMSAKAPKELEYTLYVGADDLLRQLTTDVGGSTSTITWTKWGEPVDVSAPPESETTDGSTLGDMAGLMGGARTS